MKLAIVGCGAAGSCFASFLRLGGADLTLIDPYKTHMGKVARDGMDFTIAPERRMRVTGFKTCCDASGLGVMDAVIFVTKATQIESALETAKPCIGPDTVLVSLMNGLGNEDPLCTATAEDHVLFGAGTMGTALPEPGRCIASPGVEPFLMNFGPVRQGRRADELGTYLAGCFTDGGCPAKYWDDVRPAVWTKAVFNCTLNALCAVLRMKIRYLLDNDHGWTLVRRLTEECVAVASAKGVPLETEFFIQTFRESMGRAVVNYYPSMAQDVLIHERQTEIVTLNGAISRYGKVCGVPTPANDLITEMISCMQLHYPELYPREN